MGNLSMLINSVPASISLLMGVIFLVSLIIQLTVKMPNKYLEWSICGVCLLGGFGFLPLMLNIMV